LIQASKT